MTIVKKKYTLLSIITICLRCTMFPSIIILLQRILSGLSPVIKVLVTASFIDTAINIVGGGTDFFQITPSALALAGIVAYDRLSYRITNFAGVRMENGLREKLRVAITEQMSRLKYFHIESQDSWDKISRVAKEPEKQLRGVFWVLTSIVYLAIRIVGLLSILVSQIWWAAIVIVAFSIPLFYLAMKGGKASYDANRETSKYKRKYEYLHDILTNRETAEERSLFSFTPEVRSKWFEQFEIARKIQFKMELKWFIRMKLGSITTASISILIMLILIQPVLSGAITVGLFISLITAVFDLVQMMSWELSYYADEVAKNVEYMKDFTDFANMDTVAVSKEQSNEKGSTPNFDSLEFKNVSFKYPNTDKTILSGLNLKMERGKHYAFVGANGSGKTTITKILTGMFDNYEGEIFINNKNLNTYSQSELNAFFAVVYQDFAKYYIPLKDNISIGDINNKNANIRNVIKQIELEEAVTKLKKGIDTPLGKILEDGVDISGGEWQRVAMARAIINPAPINILDEPTAALDPISESKLYEEFESISRGKTTVFISHRLGSTKLADEIFVIENGHVSEKGGHEELMKQNGTYAEMFESQRSWYK